MAVKMIGVKAKKLGELQAEVGDQGVPRLPTKYEAEMEFRRESRQYHETQDCGGGRRIVRKSTDE